LYTLKLENVNIRGDIIIIDLTDTKTNISRTFAVTNPNWVETVKKYMQVRLKLSGNRKNFFMRYEKGRCVNSPVGINTIGTIPNKIAKYLNLDCPMDYTGHNFRRTSATLLANRGGDFLAIKKHGGWKSSAVAEGYVEHSLKRQIEVAKMIGDDAPSTSKKMYCVAATSSQIVGELCHKFQHSALTYLNF
jgi:integrase